MDFAEWTGRVVDGLPPGVLLRDLDGRLVQSSWQSGTDPDKFAKAVAADPGAFVSQPRAATPVSRPSTQSAWSPRLSVHERASVYTALRVAAWLFLLGSAANFLGVFNPHIPPDLPYSASETLRTQMESTSRIIGISAASTALIFWALSCLVAGAQTTE